MKYIMAGDRKVVQFDDRFDYEILDETFAPLYINKRGNIKRWIEERAVDSARANSRAVKARQRLSKTASDYETAMKMDAATITDDFWVKDFCINVRRKYGIRRAFFIRKRKWEVLYKKRNN